MKLNRTLIFVGIVVVLFYLWRYRRAPDIPLATISITRADGTTASLSCTVRIDTPVELDQFNAGGILPFVLRKLLAS